MKALLAIVTLSAVVAAPAFAQPTSSAHTRAYHREQPMVQMYGAEHYEQRPYNQDVNPDFQLGGNRS